jgi:hypothetical protein
VIELPGMKYKPAKINRSEKERIHFKLVCKEKVLAENFADIFLFPAEKNPVKYSINVYDPEKKLNVFTHQLEDNFKIEKSSSLLVTNVVDSSILSNLYEGYKVICLVDSSTALPESSSVKIINRNSDWYDGNWASNLNWNRKKDHLFSNVSFSKSFGFETVQSSSEWVLGNIPPGKFSDVHAGMFAGWIHLNSGYITAMKEGKGRLIFCTFPLAENYPKDPFAFHLFHNLVNYIGSENYQSSLSFLKK